MNPLIAETFLPFGIHQWPVDECVMGSVYHRMAINEKILLSEDITLILWVKVRYCAGLTLNFEQFIIRLGGFGTAFKGIPF